MMIRSVVVASVCTVLLAATAAVPVAAAAEKPSATQVAVEAFQAFQSGNAKDAVAHYSEAIESRELSADDLARALLNRALAWQHLGQHREAIDDYSAAMRIDALAPRLRAVALYNRGLSQMKLELLARAIDDFTNALFLDAGFSEAYYSRGNALRLSGQYLFALSDYEKALRYQLPDSYLSYYGEALTYHSLRRPEQAQKALLLALKSNPQFEPALDLLRQISTGETAPAEPKRVLNLAVTQQHVSVANGADNIVTGSLQPDQADLVVKKQALPEAQGPPASMLPVSAEVPAKEASLVAAKAAVETALATIEPTANDASDEATPPQPQTAETTATVEDTAQPEGWTVQLSSQRDADAAWSVWRKLSAKHGKLLKGADPLVYKADLGDRGVYYRLRLHRIDSRGAANKLCSRLKSRGTACFVSDAAG